MEGICVNFLDLVQFFRFLKGCCHGNQFCGKIAYHPALIALAFQQGMRYRYIIVQVNSINYAFISCKNFVNFATVTPEKTELICELFVQHGKKLTHLVEYLDRFLPPFHHTKAL